MIDETVPSVVLAWAATLATLAGLLVVLPPAVAGQLTRPALLVSPLLAAVLDWRTDAPGELLAFGVAALAAGGGLWLAVQLVAGLLAPDTLDRLRRGLPIPVVVLARVGGDRLALVVRGWLQERG